MDSYTKTHDVWPISPSCGISPVMPPRIFPTTTTSGIINTTSGIRAEGSHRLDGGECRRETKSQWFAPT